MLLPLRQPRHCSAARSAVVKVSSFVRRGPHVMRNSTPAILAAINVPTWSLLAIPLRRPGDRVSLANLRIVQAGEHLFDRGELLPAQVNLTQRHDAIGREIGGRKRLIAKPVEGGVAFMLGNDAEYSGSAVGVLFVAQRANGAFDIATRFMMRARAANSRSDPGSATPAARSSSASPTSLRNAKMVGRNPADGAIAAPSRTSFAKFQRTSEALGGVLPAGRPHCRRLSATSRVTS
jgi:hypothetical protein